MRSLRILSIAAVAAAGCLVGPVGATGLVPAHATPGSRIHRPAAPTRRISQRRTAAIERTEIGAAQLATQSPQLAAQRLLPMELDALSAEPTFKFSAVGGACDVHVAGSGGSSVVRHPAVTAAARSVSLNSGDVDELIPAGNVDGVAGTDVLDLRLGIRHQSLAAGVTARSGVTGASLWTRSLSSAKGTFAFPYVEPDLVGSTSTPGALLIQQSEPFGGSGTMPVALTAEAVDGAGTTQWSQTMSGSVTIGAHKQTLTDVPMLVGDLATADGGHDLLINVLNVVIKNSGEMHGTSQAEVISAADGSITARGDGVTSSTGLPEIVPVPDLNGDGNADLGVVDPGSAVSIEDGLTGTSIWTATDLDVDTSAELVPVGDLAGTGAQDLALVNETFDVGGVQGPSDSSSVSLIDGQSGSVAWTHHAACAYEIDAAGPSAMPAVGLISHIGAAGTTKSSRAHLTVAPRYLDGTVAYHRSITATARSPKRVRRYSFTIDVGPFGDVQADGSQDLEVRLKAAAGKVNKQVQGVLSGRNGHLVVEPPGGSTDGGLDGSEGADLIKASNEAHGVAISGYDAATGHALYRKKVTGTATLRAGVAYGVRVSGQACSDVVISAQSSSDEQVGLYDGKSDPLWTVTATAKQLVGGTVRLATPPATYCVS